MEGSEGKGGNEKSPSQGCESELTGKWRLQSAGWGPLRSGLFSLEKFPALGQQQEDV